MSYNEYHYHQYGFNFNGTTYQVPEGYYIPRVDQWGRPILAMDTFEGYLASNYQQKEILSAQYFPLGHLPQYTQAYYPDLNGHGYIGQQQVVPPPPVTYFPIATGHTPWVNRGSIHTDKGEYSENVQDWKRYVPYYNEPSYAPYNKKGSGILDVYIQRKLEETREKGESSHKKEDNQAQKDQSACPREMDENFSGSNILLTDSSESSRLSPTQKAPLEISSFQSGSLDKNDASRKTSKALDIFAQKTSEKNSPKLEVPSIVSSQNKNIEEPVHKSPEHLAQPECIPSKSLEPRQDMKSSLSTESKPSEANPKCSTDEPNQSPRTCEIIGTPPSSLNSLGGSLSGNFGGEESRLENLCDSPVPDSLPDPSTNHHLSESHNNSIHFTPSLSFGSGTHSSALDNSSPSRLLEDDMNHLLAELQKFRLRDPEDSIETILGTDLQDQSPEVFKEMSTEESLILSDSFLDFLEPVGERCISEEISLNVTESEECVVKVNSPVTAKSLAKEKIRERKLARREADCQLTYGEGESIAPNYILKKKKKTQSMLGNYITRHMLNILSGDGETEEQCAKRRLSKDEEMQLKEEKKDDLFVPGRLVLAQDRWGILCQAIIINKQTTKVLVQYCDDGLFRMEWIPLRQRRLRDLGNSELVPDFETRSENWFNDAVPGEACCKCRLPFQQFRYFCLHCPPSEDNYLCSRCYFHDFPSDHWHSRLLYARESLLTQSVIMLFKRTEGEVTRFEKDELYMHTEASAMISRWGSVDLKRQRILGIHRYYPDVQSSYKPSIIICAFCHDTQHSKCIFTGDFISLDKPFILALTPQEQEKRDKKLAEGGLPYTDLFWCHINCARFSSNVLALDSFYNLSRAVKASSRNICPHCRGKGASVACAKPGCPKVYHLKCTGKSLAFFERGQLFFCRSHETLQRKMPPHTQVIGSMSCEGCGGLLPKGRRHETECIVDIEGSPSEGPDSTWSWYTCQSCIDEDGFYPFDLCQGCFSASFQHPHPKENFRWTNYHDVANHLDRSAFLFDPLRPWCMRPSVNDKKSLKEPSPKPNPELKPVEMDTSQVIQCAYCKTSEATTWRKGYAGVVMCNDCFNCEPKPLDPPKETPVPRKRRKRDKIFITINLQTLEDSYDLFHKEPSAAYLIEKYKSGIEDYNHLPYYTRKICNDANFEDGPTQTRMLESYEPTESQWFSLLVLSSYYDIPGKAPRWASHSGSDYHGTWLPQTVRRALLRYTQPGERILSNFLGRGTDAIECFLLNRKCIGVDINPFAVALSQRNCSFGLPEGSGLSAVHRPVILHGDSRNLIDPYLFPNSSFDHVLSHPPYKDCVVYSTNIEGDLSKFPNQDDFAREMAKVINENWRLLKMGSRVTLGIGDNRENCLYVPVSYQLLRNYLDNGFELEEIIIKRQRQCQMYGLGAFLSAHYGFLIFTHEYIFTLRKAPKDRRPPATVRQILRPPEDVILWKKAVHIRHRKRAIPIYPIDRKSIVMGTVWAFRPKGKHTFEMLCKSRMVERFGTNGSNWDDITITFPKHTDDISDVKAPQELVYSEDESFAVSSYERKREIRIKENNRKLLSLGLTAELGDERSEDVTHHDKMMVQSSSSKSDLKLIVASHIPNHYLVNGTLSYYRKALREVTVDACSRLAQGGFLIIGVQEYRIQDLYGSGRLVPLSLLVFEDIERYLKSDTFDSPPLKLKEMVICVPDGYQCKRSTPIHSLPSEPCVLDVLPTDPFPNLPLVHATYMVYTKL